MTVLFVSLYCDTPHFETELELISDLLDEGHQVHVLRCTGQLGACLKNPAHLLSRCVTCVSKIDRGLSALAHPRLHIRVLPAVAPHSSLPAQFESVDELKSYFFEGANLGRGVYSSLCGRFDKDTRFDTRKHAKTVRVELEAAHAVYVATRAAIAETQAERVYIFNGRFATCLPVMDAASQAKIDCYTHERGGTPDRYLLRKNALPHDIDLNYREMVEVWGDGGEEKIALARKWFRDRRDGVETSWESFTKTQAVGKLPEGFDASRHNIAIFNSTMEEYASIDSWQLPLYQDEVVGLERVVTSLSLHDNVHIYLRIHPNLKNIPRDSNYQLRAYTELARKAKNLTVIWPEDRVHTYALLDACKVAFTFGSTVGVEACYWKRPSVLGGRALYESLDCVSRPESHEAVIAQLLDVPPPKPELGALKYGYWEQVRGTRFRHFRPIGLYGGTFKDRAVMPSLKTRLQSAVLWRLGN